MQGDGVLILAGLIGFVAGLRSLTAPAAVSWAARLGWIHLEGTALAFMGSLAAVIGFSLLAMAEYAADLHPATPRRTTPGPLAARVVLGALSGACLVLSANRPLLAGVIFGGLGGLVGAFAGYHARVRLVRALGTRDSVVALSEDLIAIVMAWCIVAWR
jgi:uncharacterized membrane protein